MCISVVKDVQKYLYRLKKKDLFGCFRYIEEIREQWQCNKFEGGRNRKSKNLTSAYSYIRDALALSLFAFFDFYLPATLAINTAAAS